MICCRTKLICKSETVTQRELTMQASKVSLPLNEIQFRPSASVTGQSLDLLSTNVRKQNLWGQCLCSEVSQKGKVSCEILKELSSK